jgi:hypothetical protein
MQEDLGVMAGPKDRMDNQREARWKDLENSQPDQGRSKEKLC